MTSTIPDIVSLATRFINSTNRNIFLTGKAGTGKTTFLRKIIEQTHKKAVIVAPTGIAAINAGGVTIHSQFQLPFGTFLPVNEQKETSFQVNTPASLFRQQQMSFIKRNVLRDLELLIIDEVSMLRADLLDAINLVLQHVRRKKHLPFGGVQVLFIGDLLQLPPVIKDEEWNLLRKYYNGIYFFNALVLKNDQPLYLELDKVYRQSDDTFISLLNNLRNNVITPADEEILDARYQPDFKPTENDKYITLTTHNYKADEINSTLLNQLKTKSVFFEAEIKDEFNEKSYPVEKNLELKIGAQVMFIKNDTSGKQQYFNGKIGVVEELKKDAIIVKCDELLIEVEPHEWKNIRYQLNEVTNEPEEKVLGTFTQYPLRLAWAITVHKSQGLTFEKAIVDVGQAFAPGQVYVALSRLKSLEGLVLKTRVNRSNLQFDNTLINFSSTKKEQEELSSLVQTESLLFTKDYLIKCFDFRELYGAIEQHLQDYHEMENNSVKVSAKDFATELLVKAEDLKKHGDNFCIQLSQAFNASESLDYKWIKERLHSALSYFTPLLRKCSASIAHRIENLEGIKKVKTYCKDLSALNTSFYEQVKKIHKADAFVLSLINQQEFNKNSVNEVVQQTASTAHHTPAPPKRERKKKKEKLGTNGEKLSSSEQTFQLYKEGKSLEAIAKERGYTINTIESHLTTYISKGLINVFDFVAKEKTEVIIDAIKKQGDLRLGPVKELLGESYTYSEIRFALAHYLSKEDSS